MNSRYRDPAWRSRPRGIVDESAGHSVKSRPLRIAFDLDGVLADMKAALVREAEDLFGPNGEPQERSDGSKPHDELAGELSVGQLTWRQRKRLWARVRRIENFWESLEEIEPGSVTRIASLAETHLWHVLFITTRPPTVGSTCQVQSQRWLQRHGFALPSVFVVPGSRGKIAAALSLDFVIDDRPENCLDVAL